MSTRLHPRLGPPGELAHGDFQFVVRRLADDLAFGTDASTFTGSGIEYAQSRPYEPGDSVRAMDWRLTARTGRAFVKEYESLKRMGVHLLVDTSASMGIGMAELTKHDLAVWCAAAIGLLAQRRLSPVAVHGGGERETRFEPSLLATDLWHAVEPLRRSTACEGTRIGRRLSQVATRARRASVIVVLSDLHDPEAIPALKRLAQRHDCIVLHLCDPAESGETGGGFFRGEEAETGRAFLGWGRSRWAVTDPITQQLRHAGLDHLLLQIDQPFLPRLTGFLRQRGALGKGTR